MNWMSVIQSIPTAWRKEMKTSIAVISSYIPLPYHMCQLDLGMQS